MKRKILTSLMVLLLVITLLPLSGDDTHAAESRFYKAGDIGEFSATVSRNTLLNIGITGTALFGDAQLVDGTLKVNGQAVQYEEAKVGEAFYYNLDIVGTATELNITWQSKILSDDKVYLNSTGGTVGYRLIGAIGGGNIGNILSEDSFAERYDANGGSGAAPVVTIRHENDPFQTKANMFTAPENKIFKEWNTMADGSGSSYAENAAFTMPANDVTFYAIWQPLNSSESSTSSTVVTPTSSQAGSETTTGDPAGYTDGTGADYSDGPKTGDTGLSGLSFILLGISVIAIGISLWRKKAK